MKHIQKKVKQKTIPIRTLRTVVKSLKEDGENIKNNQQHIFLGGFTMMNYQKKGGYPIENKKLMTIQEVSKMLNVKTSWVRSVIFRKEIPYIKLGNHIRFQEKALFDWMEKKKIS